MKIYNILKTEKVFFDVDTVKYWTINPPTDAKIVNIGEYKNYNVLYAIEYDTEQMSTSKLMEIMYEKLKLKEVKTICEKDSWINKLYINYLRNPLKDKELKKKIEEAKGSADNATYMASLAFLSSILN